MDVEAENGKNNNNSELHNNLVNNEDNDETTENPPCWKLCLQRFKHFTVEPTILLVFFSTSFTDVLGTELILTRTCRNTFGFPESECSNNTADSVRNVVQPYALNVIMAKSLIEALFPAVLSLFIGPWTDIYGRKPFLILPIIGFIISSAIWLGLSYIRTISPLYFLIASLPISFCGGVIALQACSYSYLADTTTVELRAIRMAILALFMGLGTMLGYLLTNTCDKAFKDNLPLGKYGIVIVVLVIDALYTIFFVPETVQNNMERDTSFLKKITSLFNLKHIKESMRVLFAKKTGHGRVLVLLLIPVIMLSIIIEQGEGNYLILATKAAFSWSSEQFNNFRSIMVIIGICVGVPGLWILKRHFRITDLTFLFIIMVMELASSLILAFTKITTTLYVGKAIGTFIDLVRAVAKTKISFLVLTIDLGKIFAIVSTLQAISPLIASPMYGGVYNLVLSSKPLYLFFLSTALSLLTLILLITIQAIQWKYGIKEVRRR